MRLLTTIKSPDPAIEYQIRLAARAVLFSGDRIAFLYVRQHCYHKLPGGGIEGSEGVLAALARELMEEVGCQAEVGGEIGMIIEYRDKLNEKQISYCYSARITKNFGQPNFTDKERAEGFELIWVELDEAIRLLENDRPDDYFGKFIVQRDLIFLKEAKNIL